jgi:hypothetical protein
MIPPNTRNASRYKIRQALLVLLLAALLAFSPVNARSHVLRGVAQSHALAVKCQCNGTEKISIIPSR